MNNQTAKMLTAALGALLVVVLGATIFILLTRPSAPVGPTPTPTGSGLAVATPTFTPSPLLTPSPSSSLSPSPTALATPSLVPTESPSASPVASPSVSPSPSPSASASASPIPSTTPEPSATPTTAPSIAPTAPQQQLVLVDVGIDSREFEGRVERSVSFAVDGPSQITASTSNASASGIRLCLFPTNDGPSTDRCDIGGNMTLSAANTDTGTSSWTATMIGTEANVSPFATLTLTFNANAGAALLQSFRYTGTNSNEYNGFDARVTGAGAGEVAVDASFESGQFTYQLWLGAPGADPTTGGPAGSIEESASVSGGGPFRISIRSPESQVVSENSVFIRAELNWP